MFILKKIVSRFLFPVPLSLELLFLGLVLLWFTRRQRAGKALVTCGALLLLGLSNSFVATRLLQSLEQRYPPFVAAHSDAAALSPTYIVVLGGFGNDDPNVPMTSHISPDLMVRLIEGVRVHGELAGSKLILSGGKYSAEGMSRMAEVLGVSAGDIQRLDNPRDTEEESQQVAPIVGSQKLILVTSASHMPRAMGLFRKKGMQPIAAPTDFLAPNHPFELDDFVPDGYNLFKSQVAFYEYLGLAWGKLRGKI